MKLTERIVSSRVRLMLLFFLVPLFLIVCLLLWQHLLARRPKVILISIDALRASNLGCYGYNRDTTPNIDEMAKDSVLFSNAIVQQPWTLSSHMSMLTSVYPLVHGVDFNSSLSPKIPTLPEVLKKQGFRTAGFATCLAQMKGEFGFERGFDTYEVNYWNAKELNNRVLSWLENNREAPFFLFLHYYDVHSDTERLPYDSPELYMTRFAEPREHYLEGEETPKASQYLKHLHKNRIELPREEINYLKALYDGGVAFTDAQIGKLFEKLHQLNLYDNSLIILTADHGEEFQEHGGMLHYQIYDEVTRVPLLIKFPRGKKQLRGLTISSIVQSIDIMPTVLDYLGLAPGPKCQQGSSLMTMIRHGNDQHPAYVFGWDELRGMGYYAIQEGEWKLHFCPDTDTVKLYNMVRDLTERNDVIDEYPETAQELKARLLRWIEETAELRNKYVGDKDNLINEKDKEILRSLGYFQ